MKITPLRLFLLLVLTFAACGAAPPADTASTAQDLDWSWQTYMPNAPTQPWLCWGTYNPLTQPPPADGHCDFQPSTTPQNPLLYQVTNCFAGGDAYGAHVDLYTGLDLSGQCARLWGPLDHARDEFGTGTGWTYNPDFVRASGWHSNLTGYDVHIRSAHIAPHTAVTFCDQGINGTFCGGHAAGYGNITGVGVNENSILFSGPGSNIDVMAINVGLYP